MTQSVPKTIHLTVHTSGGGTEANVARLCEAVPEFVHLSLQELMGFPVQWSRLPAAVKAVRAENPNVIFAYGITAHFVAFAAQQGEMALVGNIRSDVDFAGWKGIVWRQMERRFAHWVSNSRAAIEKLPRVPHAFSVIYNGIPEPPAGELRNSSRRDAPNMVMLARGHASKGHRFVLDLWKRLEKRGTLTFAGNLGEDLKRDAESEGVACPGFVPPGVALRGADLLLVASDHEGIPTAMLDAMMRGVPTLATPVGGIAEILTHGENGFLSPRERWEDMLRGITLEKINEVGIRAREYAMKHATFDRMKNEFIEVAKAVCRQDPA